MNFNWKRKRKQKEKKAMGINNILHTKMPYIGMIISSKEDRPILSYSGYTFCGTYLTEKGETKLIDIKWSNSKTGELISNNEFISKFFAT